MIRWLVGSLVAWCVAWLGVSLVVVFACLFVRCVVCLFAYLFVFSLVCLEMFVRRLVGFLFVCCLLGWLIGTLFFYSSVCLLICCRSVFV